MATGFTQAGVDNDELKAMIAERIAQGLHSRDVPLPPAVRAAMERERRLRQESVAPGPAEIMKQNLGRFMELGGR